MKDEGEEGKREESGEMRGKIKGRGERDECATNHTP